MMNEIPSAVISGAIRGALRSGLYAKRSISTPSTPVPNAASKNMIATSSGTGITSAVGPPNHWITK